MYFYTDHVPTKPSITFISINTWRKSNEKLVPHLQVHVRFDFFPKKTSRRIH